MSHLVVFMMLACCADEMRGTERNGVMGQRQVTMTVSASMRERIPLSNGAVEPRPSADRASDANPVGQAVDDEVPQGRIKIVVETSEVDSTNTPDDSAAGPAVETPVNLGLERDPMARPESPTWWLGVNCSELPDPLRQHLRIDHGLIVGCVAPESPAADAGLLPNDILIGFESQPILGTDDLMGLVDQTEGRPVLLQIVRAGQCRNVRVLPSRRPEAEPLVMMVDPMGRPFDGSSRELLNKLVQEKAALGCSLVLVRPGVVIDREFDSVDAELHSQFFPFPTETVGWNFGQAPWSNGSIDAMQASSVFAGRPRWQNEQVQIGDTRIVFFPFQGEGEQVRWVQDGNRLAGEALSLPAGGRSVTTIVSMDGTSVDELRLNLELKQWRSRTVELESEVRLLREEVEFLKTHLQRLHEFPAPTADDEHSPE
ncbi:MAG: PDZ domain-containing protein [Pirellulaceae bacterium]